MSEDHADPDQAGQVHHIELNGSDLERAIDFWGWLLGQLGYTEKQRFDGGRSWVNGPTYLVVLTSETATPFDSGSPGLNHLAFHAASRDLVDEITDGVRNRADADVLFEERHPYAGGYYALYCEGPEDVKIEVGGPE